MYLYTFFVYNFFLLSSMHVFSLQNPHLYIFRFSSSENSRNCQRCNNNKCDCSLYLRFSSPFATHTHTPSNLLHTMNMCPYICACLIWCKYKNIICYCYCRYCCCCCCSSERERERVEVYKWKAMKLA